jgi:hypothetical protein
MVVTMKDALPVALFFLALGLMLGMLWFSP